MTTLNFTTPPVPVERVARERREQRVSRPVASRKTRAATQRPTPANASDATDTNLCTLQRDIQIFFC